MNDLINISNNNVDFIKRSFEDIFINKIAKIYDLNWVHLWNWFLYFTSECVDESSINVIIIINQRFKCNNY
jgi:hypothetical protein